MTLLQSGPNRSSAGPAGASGTHPTSGVVPFDITVLAGGPGPEREVSLNSGRAIHEALRRVGHRVTLCDISPEDLSALDREADFVFIALHGQFGEDGTLQAELDARGIHYGGSGPAASRLAMNKVESKRRFVHAGIATPQYEVIGRDHAPKSKSKVGLPVVIKPVDSGSSVDTTIARAEADAERVIARLVQSCGAALVERYIVGPELTVGVLGDEALPVCEIRTKREFYDYSAKYLDEDTQYLFDLDLPPALLQKVQALSLTAHRALGCRAFSRVDWMVEAATLELYILEINTIPGFTSHSLLPKSAVRAGMSLEQLCQRIVELSLNEPTHA